MQVEFWIKTVDYRQFPVVSLLHNTGEMRGPDGERCVLYNWDRPLGDGLAVLLRSASCESRERTGWMVAHELSRTIITLSQSNLKDGEEE